MLADRMEAYFEALGLDLKPGGKGYVGPCPVHGGSSYNGVIVYPDGFAVRGNWECFTRKCHRHFPRSLLGLTRGVLSHRKLGFEPRENPDAKVPHFEAVNFALEFLGVDRKDVKVDHAAAARARLVREVDTITREARSGYTPLCSPGEFREKLEIPSKYYLGRGYREETLRYYEVGEVTRKGSPHFGRTLIPVYEASGKVIVGALSRSPHPKCGECSLCHKEGTPCPDGDSRHRFLRWTTVGSSFNDKHHLYNLPNATRHIKLHRSVVVVEGAGDVWRLNEAGVKNVVGLFGSDPTDSQIIALEGLLPRKIVVLTDNNAAGDSAFREIARRCRFANVSRLRPAGADEPSDMTAASIVEHLVPAIRESYAQR